MSFEGPEKKLKLTLRRGARPLRARSATEWAAFVEASGAQVLERREFESWDAYLLSESTLFVGDESLNLITCGRTNPAAGLATLLSLVDRRDIERVICERKSEHFPALQPTTFDDDVARLVGAGLPVERLRVGHSSAFVDLAVYEAPGAAPPRDLGIEILMHAPSDAARRAFEPVGPARDLAVARSLVAPIVEGFETQEHVFEPLGYSLNAVRGELCAALHVTPEAEGSYASWELQGPSGALPETEPSQRVRQLGTSFAPESLEILGWDSEAPGIDLVDYTRVAHAQHPLGGYELSYAQWVRDTRFRSDPADS